MLLVVIMTVSGVFIVCLFEISETSGFFYFRVTTVQDQAFHCKQTETAEMLEIHEWAPNHYRLMGKAQEDPNI